MARQIGPADAEAAKAEADAEAEAEAEARAAKAVKAVCRVRTERRSAYVAYRLLGRK